MKRFLRKDKTGLYIMATTAYHKTGNISRDKPDLAIVFSEDDDNLYGNWMFGYGFINVKFPKNTVKKLTENDIKKFNKISYGINNQILGKLDITNDYIWEN